MKRKIEDYKNKPAAIHCSTKEEWDKIVDLFPSYKNVKKFHWQHSVNNGKSDTINISGGGWSPKKRYEDKGYTIYPASDFLEEKPFKFNIGDEIEAKPGGYYISSPQYFAEIHKAKFPSEKSGISSKITERTQAKGFNWYRCGNSNWITEEGIELVKEDIPEYVECIDTEYFIPGCSSVNEHNLKKGTIYKVSSKKPESDYSKKIVLETEKGHIEIGCNDYQTLYKSSTKEAFDLQNKPKTMNEDVFCIELNSQGELDAIMDFYKQKGFKEFADNFYKKEEKVILEMRPYPKDNYFKAVVVKDIHKKDITIQGNIPDLIPKGYQTWFIDEDIGCREDIFQSGEHLAYPEDNRWGANIPIEYFQIVEDEKYNDIPKEQWIPKYKIGDIFKGLIGEVTITEIGKFKEKAYRLDDNKCFDTEEYVDTLKCLSNEWTPKIGDYVVITKGTNNWASMMNHYIGKVAKLTSCLSYDKNTFRIDLDNGDWEWQLKHNHFRKAEPDEIPLKQTTMSMQEIQQICKEKYPIGCKYKCAIFNYECILLQDDCTYTIINNEIWASYGKGCLYSNGKYAELISLPKSDWNPQIGDHVIITSPEEKNNWVSGMDKYVGKLAKLTKKRGDTSFEIDLDNAYHVWDYKLHHKFFRKAEPHEISTISKSFEFFKEGDKVLIKDGCGYYHQGIDSIGEKMIGIISNVTSTSLPFIVKWSNGSQDSYNKEHLEHYVEMTSSKSISPTMLEIAKSKYPLGTFYIDSYERKQEVKGILTIEKDIITDEWGGAVYEKGKWAKIVDALYNDNKSEQKTSTSENYPLPPTKSVTKKKREIILVPLIQPKTVKVFDREENFF